MPVIRFKKRPWRYGMSYFMSCGNQKYVIHATYMDQRASLAARLLRARNNLRLRVQQKKGGSE